MTAFQIVATRKDGPDQDRRIDAVELLGGTQLTLDQTIQWIAQGHTFWTVAPGQPRAMVRLVPGGPFKLPYLTTASDGILPNNLLQLRDMEQSLGDILAQALRR